MFSSQEAANVEDHWPRAAVSACIQLLARLSSLETEFNDAIGIVTEDRLESILSLWAKVKLDLPILKYHWFLCLPKALSNLVRIPKYGAQFFARDSELDWLDPTFFAQLPEPLNEVHWVYVLLTFASASRGSYI